MTWRAAGDYGRSRDAVDVLAGLVRRQHDPAEAALDVLQRLAEALHVEVVIVPKKGGAVSVAEIEAVAEALLDVLGRGLADTDESVAEQVEGVRVDVEERLCDLGESYREWTR